MIWADGIIYTLINCLYKSCLWHKDIIESALSVHWPEILSHRLKVVLAQSQFQGSLKKTKLYFFCTFSDIMVQIWPVLGLWFYTRIIISVSYWIKHGLNFYFKIAYKSFVTVVIIYFVVFLYFYLCTCHPKNSST